MTISKIDLLGKKFNRCMRGYCTEEVDLVVHDAAEALGEAADENRRLHERIAALERAVQQKTSECPPPSAGQDLRGALAAGRKIVEDIHENARREARGIVEEARAEASRIKAEANLVKARIYEEIVEIRAQREAFDQELRKLLEDHFRLLEASQSSPDNDKSGGDFIFNEGQE
ncbi:MAG: DivIVA domain-containing protein [Thermodesulfobacteriota bacterium]